jgi:hypothetical protein
MSTLIIPDADTQSSPQTFVILEGLLSKYRSEHTVSRKITDERLSQIISVILKDPEIHCECLKMSKLLGPGYREQMSNYIDALVRIAVYAALNPPKYKLVSKSLEEIDYLDKIVPVDYKQMTFQDKHLADIFLMYMPPFADFLYGDKLVARESSGTVLGITEDEARCNRCERRSLLLKILASAQNVAVIAIALSYDLIRFFQHLGGSSLFVVVYHTSTSLKRFDRGAVVVDERYMWTREDIILK